MLALSVGPKRIGPLMYTTAVVECRVCGDEGVLAVDVVVKAAEIATFASAHSSHGRFDIHLRLGDSDGYLGGSQQHLQLGRSPN
jgi:hypothetical protein